MNIDDITMLDPEEIPYGDLSDEDFKTLVLGSHDNFIVTFALSEISGRQSSFVESLTLQLLTEEIGDKYVQAQAFKALYLNNKDLAIKFIERFIQRGSDVELSAIVEMIVMDLDEFKVQKESLGFLTCLIDKVKSVDANSFSDADEITRFLKEFS